MHEFEFIHSLKNPRYGADSHLIQGIGDDACVLNSKKQQVISTDALVENVHFSFRWSSLNEILEKALLVNLSDINAMGARANDILLTVGFPPDKDPGFKMQFSKILTKLFKKYSLNLIGGDTVSSPVFLLNITAIGYVEKEPLLRSQAEIGHNIYLSNSLGKSHLGYKSLLKNLSGNAAKEFIEYHKIPVVALDLGPKLYNSNLVSSCIDLSDGLSSELNHLVNQSHVKMVIREDELPFSPAQYEVAKLLGENSIDVCLNGGEEYQLLFTADQRIEETSFFHEENLFRIGTVQQGEGAFLKTAQGLVHKIHARGFNHFQ